MKRVTQIGFTLLEILLAMLLLSLLVGMAYAGISAGLRSSESSHALIEQSNRLRLTQEFLRRQISQAMPSYYASDPIHGTASMFEGSSTMMRFVATMPGYLGHGGAYVQTLSLQRGRDGLELVFEHEPLIGYEPDGRLREREPPVRLLGGIERGRFEFARIDLERNQVQWVDDWEDTHLPPLMVRIALDLKAESRMGFPEMLVPLMIDGPGMHRPALQRGSMRVD